MNLDLNVEQRQGIARLNRADTLERILRSRHFTQRLKEAIKYTRDEGKEAGYTAVLICPGNGTDVVAFSNLQRGSHNRVKY